MKRIISALIICAMLFATLLAVVPASAEELTTREKLKEQIDIATALTGDVYSEATWSTLQNAIESAQAAYDNTSSTELILNMQLSNLKSAIAALRVDTSELDALLAYVDTLEAASESVKRLGYEQGDFTAESWEAFLPAIDAAKAAKASNDVDTIAAGVVAFEEAIAEIEFNPIPAEMAANLATYLELADILIPEDFSDSAWGMVELKVAQAEELKDDQRISTQQKVVAELETALRNLDPDKELPKPPVLDYSYLDELIKYIDDSFTADMFTEESWAALMTAYDNAKKVRETTKKQAELYAAWETLNTERQKLVLAPKPTETDPPATEPPATEPPAEEAGCGGFVATSVVVVAAVATLGTAVVLKKKED